MLKSVSLLLIFSLITFFLFTYRITDVPPGINGDEAAIGTSAALISKTGYDAQQQFLPLFTNTINSPDWKQPVTVYATALVFKIFGVSYFALRATSVIFVVLSLLFIYLLVKEIADTKVAIAAAFLFLTTPIVMIQSHLAIENIAPVPFVSAWLLMLIKFTKKQNYKLLMLAGAFLGISLFSYLGMRVIAPVFFVLTLVYVYYLNRVTKGQYLNTIKWFLVGFVPFILVLLLSKFNYTGVLLGQYRLYKIEDYQTLILPYLSTFDPSFLFLRGDSTPYHSTGKQGMFLLASLPMFILGLVNIIKTKKPILILILMSFFLAPLLFGLGSTIYRASRLLAMIPFYIVIASVGIQQILAVRQQQVRKGILVIVTLLISLNFVDFLNDYWYQYPQRVKADFAKPIHDVYKGLATTAKEKNLTPYAEYYLFKQYPDAETFFKWIYFPQGLSEWYREKEIPPQSIILTDLSNFKSKEKISTIKVEELDYYFIIRTK